MSRCFPFPPPGYEKKARSDQADLLIKEKQKEKKHKKKRDKEKREGKERKDKDRSKDKHKEKGDRKERHRDKKRDKDKDKDKSRPSDDRRIEEQTHGREDEKFSVRIQNAAEVKDSRFTEEFGRRINNQEKGASNRMFEDIPGPLTKEVEGLGTTAVQKERSNGNGMVANLLSKEQRGIDGNKMVAKNLLSKEQRGIDGNRMVAKNLLSKEHRGIDGNRMVANLISKEQREIDGNKMVANLTTKEHRKIDGIEQPEKDGVKKVEERVAKDREVGDGKGNRESDRDQEKRNKSKDKDRHKQKEKQKDKIREKGEHKHKDLDKTKDTEKKVQLYSNLKTIAPHNDNEKFVSINGHNKKRKDFEMNGFSHENDVRPSKLSKPVSSSHPSGENGRTLELCRVSISHSSNRHGNMNNIKAERVLDTKEHKINGAAEPQPSPADLRPSVAAGTSVKSETSSTPPHPDSKYLSQIYSVPKMEDWLESDNQVWLFSSSSSQLKPKASFEAAPQVWAKGLQVDSADVFALPYVIPY